MCMQVYNRLFAMRRRLLVVRLQAELAFYCTAWPRVRKSYPLPSSPPPPSLLAAAVNCHLCSCCVSQWSAGGGAAGDRVVTPYCSPPACQATRRLGRPPLPPSRLPASRASPGRVTKAPAVLQATEETWCLEVGFAK